MALSAARKTRNKPGEIIAYPVKSATTIYAGGFVMLDSTGYLVMASIGGGRLVGIAVETVANPSGGDLVCRVQKTGLFKFAKTGTIVQANAGAPLAIHDDETVKLAVATLTTVLTGANNDLVWTAKGDLLGERGEAITVEYRNPAAALAAGTLTTALTGNNNDLVWTEKAAYAGAGVTVEYRDPYATLAIKGATEYIEVAGNGITVWLATDAGTGAITSTGDTIKATLALHAVANAMVSAADAAANDGSGVVTAMSPTRLSSGDYAGDLATLDGSDVWVRIDRAVN